MYYSERVRPNSCATYTLSCLQKCPTWGIATTMLSGMAMTGGIVVSSVVALRGHWGNGRVFRRRGRRCHTLSVMLHVPCCCARFTTTRMSSPHPICGVAQPASCAGRRRGRHRYLLCGVASHSHGSMRKSLPSSVAARSWAVSGRHRRMLTLAPRLVDLMVSPLAFRVSRRPSFRPT